MVGATVIATPRSTDAAPTMNVSVDVLFAAVRVERVDVVTEAVLAIDGPGGRAGPERREAR